MLCQPVRIPHVERAQEDVACNLWNLRTPPPRCLPSLDSSKHQTANVSAQSPSSHSYRLVFRRRPVLAGTVLSIDP
ncbi:hypothetical protein B296_00051985 [Ensete ventricosum]|uniref:Uncharacterized protein n=1 Tax=Ensete ventricosum TaxID=4639 RepID=A0A426YA72_ENSVE|nr:hypothetical protein B296_00051985 [Ensete ventricosum]